MTRLIVLVPIFNDWQALRLLLLRLDCVAVGRGPMRVIVIDDHSTDNSNEHIADLTLRALEAVEIVRLRRNLGHQRAICVGLVYTYQHFESPTTVVMDGDGEDKPEDVEVLLDRFAAENGRKIIFAERRKRNENVSFKAFYILYRLLHYALTGISVRVGNFSVIPYSALSSLVVTSESWNHYAAAVFHARLPHSSVPISRGARLYGKSHMNFISLVVHGLSAIAVYADRVSVRVLTVSGISMLIVLICVFVTVGIRLFTHFAVAGWATYVTGLLVIMLIQIISISLQFAFMILNSRSQTMFLPLRDCPLFVGEVSRIERSG